LRIAFLDAAPMDYNVETPYERPTGGTQSAVAYLSVELARLGHKVFLISGTKQRGIFRDVECLAIHEHGSGEFLNTMDVVIVATMPLGTMLRQVQGVTTQILLWIHIPPDQPMMLALQDDYERAAWDGFVFVSHWQRDQYLRAYQIPVEKTGVMGNAVSPSFASQPTAPAWFETGRPPMLVYTTTPYRGLVHLLDAFPTIQEAVPDVSLRVFSTMKVYQGLPAEDAQFDALYQRCAAMPGVSYIGGLGQRALAEATAEAAALCYPCTFPESSCIVAMEAMAVGAMVLATKTGALMETTAGFGRGVPWNGDPARLVSDYAELTIHALDEARRNPQRAASVRQDQIAFTRSEYVWPKRAREWTAWLGDYLSRRDEAPTC
jgi:glycosyltransferase involved in cell wall biosynthesis